MIGLDAAEITLVERGMAEGSLRHLARLRAQGAFGPLSSTADRLVGSPWPSFVTSSWPSDHGFYNYLQWRPERMTHQRPDDSWLPLAPFWRQVEPSLQTVAIDVPLTYPPKPHGGVELSGWSSHDKLWPPASHPPSLLKEVVREFGGSPMPPEATGLQTAAELLRQRDQLLRATQRTAELTHSFMRRYPWDLFVVAFGATHRAGHKLWNETGLSRDPAPQVKAELGSALDTVYRACDIAVGRLLDATPPEARVLVFALHGMGPNHSRHCLLPAMLERVLAGPAGSPATRPGPGGALARLRGLIPLSWRSGLKGRLPKGLQDRLALFWRKELWPDWSRTRAFAPVCDLEGYVQVNQKGRERDGIVGPAEREALLEEIAEGLRTFVDEETGAPIVQSTGRSHELYPAGEKVGQLPDLTVGWGDSPAHAHRAVVSPRYGRIAWPTPGKNPDGRSGHHRPTGWLLASGPGIEPGSEIGEASILDLAPTVLTLLDAPLPYRMRGRPIQGLAGS